VQCWEMELIQSISCICGGHIASKTGRQSPAAQASSEEKYPAEALSWACAAGCELAEKKAVAAAVEKGTVYPQCRHRGVLPTELPWFISQH
jgi:hypothetical protein